MKVSLVGQPGPGTLRYPGTAAIVSNSSLLSCSSLQGAQSGENGDLQTYRVTSAAIFQEIFGGPLGQVDTGATEAMPKKRVQDSKILDWCPGSLESLILDHARTVIRIQIRFFNKLMVLLLTSIVKGPRCYW